MGSPVAGAARLSLGDLADAATTTAAHTPSSERGTPASKRAKIMTVGDGRTLGRTWVKAAGSPSHKSRVLCGACLGWLQRKRKKTRTTKASRTRAWSRSATPGTIGAAWG